MTYHLKNKMKFIPILFATLLFLNACTSKPGQSNEQRLRLENFELRKENDSLKNIIVKANRSFEADTIQKIKPDKSVIRQYPTLVGKHGLTLQWISWDEPGSVTIVLAENGWYAINGSQKGKNPNNYVKINGRIKPITDRELEFEGEIETQIESINGGKPCLKTGKKIFKATGERKYWRLQDMLNCEGNMVTDYVDIYF